MRTSLHLWGASPAFSGFLPAPSPTAPPLHLSIILPPTTGHALRIFCMQLERAMRQATRTSYDARQRGTDHAMWCMMEKREEEREWEHETLVCSAHISLSFHSTHTPSSFHPDVALHPLRANYSVDDGIPQAPPAVVKTRMARVHPAPLGDKDGGGEWTPTFGIITTFALFMFSTTKLQQLYQQFLPQVSCPVRHRCPLSFLPGLVVCGHWFNCRLTFAIGFPVGPCILAFIVLACFTVASLTIKTRRPPKPLPPLAQLFIFRASAIGVRRSSKWREEHVDRAEYTSYFCALSTWLSATAWDNDNYPL
ncbi:hypothetical protein DFH08DRAFT_966148 [Mycena albidolilacea]|uniref:Uncharacterized protein n=1 Tax=Mycena albidolilacea TaxID=1033008 RepID=A0AAD6ZP98_9AGAR|nr:hypothetical protein DFH08DRAFT_966148 [Mycena albidolilacea]